MTAKRRKTLTLGLISLAFLAAGWVIIGQQETHTVVDPASVQQRIERDSSVVILDVRTPGEWLSPTGHLRGAVLIPVQSLTERLRELEPYKDRHIIVYCRTQNRSAHAAGILREQGFDVSVMAGGITRWNQEGRPVVREDGQ